MPSTISLRFLSAGVAAAAAASAAVIWTTACGSEKPVIDRNAVLRGLADNVIVPSWKNLESSAQVLEDASGKLCAGPADAALQSARAAWRQSRNAWFEGWAFHFGPAMDMDAKTRLDRSPIDPERIEKDEIGGTHEFSDTYMETLTALKKGFLAVEYVLYDSGQPANVLEKFTGTAGARRCQYLTALAKFNRTTAASIAAKWAPGGGNFANELAAAGNGSARYKLIQNAYDDLMNHNIMVAQKLSNTMLGRPSGLRDGVEPNPKLVDVWRSGTGLDDLRYGLKGLQLLYGGAPSSGAPSLRDLIAERNPEVDKLVTQDFAAAFRAMDDLKTPLHDAVTEDKEKVKTLYAALKAVYTRFQADLASLLGITVSVLEKDND